MNSAKGREVPKGAAKTGIGGGGGSGSNKPGNRNTTKGDIKSEKADLNPKIQATAEQMQIARIIESHRSEDPELQKKIKKVIEITGTTLDEASMALHSRDNNLEDAITLLTEGGTKSLELEWEQAGKKKKMKNAVSKVEAGKDQSGQRKENGPGGRDRSERRTDRDSRPDRGERENTLEQPIGDGSYFEPRRSGRGRGRGENRGGRGGMGRGGIRVENKENDESGDRTGFVPKYSNGPMRGRGRGGGRGGYRGGDRDRDASRTFASRTRGSREGDFSHHTIDMWENSQADTKTETKPNLTVDKWNEFPPAEEWDNEEYTGSLAESKVFVPSTQVQSGTESAAAQPTPPNVETTHMPTETGTNSVTGPTNHIGSGNSVVAGQSIDLSLLLSKPAPQASVANAGANLLASIQSSYSSAASQQIPVGNNQPIPSRPKVSAAPSQSSGSGRQNQRTVPSKIPTSGVEMPDDSVAQLDVQFGGLDFGSTGSGFNSVVQHGGTKGGGDMMYNSGTPQSNLVDNYTAAVEAEMVQTKSSIHPPKSASPFQAHQRGTVTGNAGSLMSDSIPKSVPMSPPHMDNNQQLASLSSVPSQKPSVSQSPQQSQQPSSYMNAATAGHNSAFVTYNTKPAPGFPAPGFPPVISQTPQTGYNAIPTGQMYGSQPSVIMTQPQQAPGYGLGLSTYGTLPIVSASVQPSQLPGHTIPNQSMSQMNSVYGMPGGVPGNPYQAANSIPSSVGYTGGSTYNNAYNPYQKLNPMMNNPGQLQGAKETVNDVGNPSATVAVTTSAPANSGIGTKIPASTSSSKLQNAATGTTAAGTGMPPGMVITTPQYILNQGALQGMPMYGFQGPPMYGYDENQLQFLPRIPHPALAASYFDANASTFTPGGSGRTDGSSMQSYPGPDARFTRSDSSAASPVPSSLPGQTAQQMYNIPQGTGYYYLGNNALMHPGAFTQYAAPHQMYPTTGLVTPNNPSSGAPHTVSNQYQNKGMYGNSYVNPYDNAAQTGNVTDYVNKNSYSTGSGAGGPNSAPTGGKGSSSSTGSSQQSTDMSSSMYGNKGHLNKMNPYEKQQYGGGSASTPYNSMGQNPMGGAGGMGTPYNVYMQPAAVLPPHIMFQDGSSGRQGQPKGGKQQQYGQQQYWSGN